MSVLLMAFSRSALALWGKSFTTTLRGRCCSSGVSRLEWEVIGVGSQNELPAHVKQKDQKLGYEDEQTRARRGARPLME